MAKIPDIVPVTDLRQDATSILKKVTASETPVVITQRGRASAVLVSMDSYDNLQNELQILRALAVGEKEIEEGRGYGLDEVLKRADKTLKKRKP